VGIGIIFETGAALEIPIMSHNQLGSKHDRRYLRYSLFRASPEFFNQSKDKSFEKRRTDVRKAKKPSSLNLFLPIFYFVVVLITESEFDDVTLFVDPTAVHTVRIHLVIDSISSIRRTSMFLS